MSANNEFLLSSSSTPLLELSALSLIPVAEHKTDSSANINMNSEPLVGCSSTSITKNSSINRTNNVKPVDITSRDYDNITNNNSKNDEYIQDACYVGMPVYPPPAEYVEIYDLWERHQACFWSSSENKPSYDFDKFARADPELQRIVMEVVACLMHGDSVVLDTLSGNLLQTITVEPVIAFFKDQEAREMIHKAVYSKMLEISPRAKYYRSLEFINLRMHSFMAFAERYKQSMDIRVLLYCIMLCEQIMFAPMFHLICYLATTGFAQNLCKSNELVMRDEYLHYRHARLILSRCRRRLNFNLANSLLDDMVEITTNLIKNIVGEYNSPDGQYNLSIALGHFHYVVHNFKIENKLYKNIIEQRRAHKLYQKSPAAMYMSDVELENKSNLMESDSTVYGQRGNNMPIDMQFKFNYKNVAIQK